MSLAIFTNIWVIFIIGFTTISPWALLQALPREKKATAPGHWISTHQPKMTASSHIIHSPNWHRGWNPASSGIWSAWSFPQLLLKSLFFFSNVKQKFPFLVFPITLLIVIFLFNGHLGRNVDIAKDNYPVHGNNCHDRSSNNLHKNRGNGVAHKGRTWPRGDVVYTKVPQKSLLFWHWYSTWEMLCPEFSPVRLLLLWSAPTVLLLMQREWERLGWGLRDECFHCSLQDDLETVQRLSCLVWLQENLHIIKYNSIGHNFQASCSLLP